MNTLKKTLIGPLRRARRPSERRLAFIDFRLAFAGDLRRSLLIDEFKISPQQATKDIKAYMELAENNLKYSLPLKSYLATDNVQPVFAGTTSKVFLRRLALVANGSKRYRNWVASDIPTAVSNAPVRSVDEEVLQILVNSLRRKRSISFDYVSINSGEKKRRNVVPRAFGSDGYRWHVRAWDIEEQEFSDFVMSRVTSPSLGMAEEHPTPHDTAWHTQCDVVLVPKTSLPDPSREAVAEEFKMLDGQLRVSTTKAMIFYTLRGYGFDPRNYDKNGRLVNRSLVPLEIYNIKEVEKLLGRRTPKI